MRVIENAPPVERKTTIEFTDREVQILARAAWLASVDRGDNALPNQTRSLWVALDNLRQDLALPDLDLETDTSGK